MAVVNLGIFFGPTLLAELTDDIPNDFQPSSAIGDGALPLIARHTMPGPPGKG